MVRFRFVAVAKYQWIASFPFIPAFSDPCFGNERQLCGLNATCSTNNGQPACRCKQGFVDIGATVFGQQRNIRCLGEGWFVWISLFLWFIVVWRHVWSLVTTISYTFGISGRVRADSYAPRKFEPKFCDGDQFFGQNYVNKWSILSSPLRRGRMCPRPGQLLVIRSVHRIECRLQLRVSDRVRGPGHNFRDIEPTGSLLCRLAGLPPVQRTWSMYR